MCECGAFKVYGAKFHEQGHSLWCPWSPKYVPKPKCEHYITDVMQCGQDATKWLKYGSSGKWYYCDDCFVSVMSNSAQWAYHSHGDV